MAVIAHYMPLPTPEKLKNELGSAYVFQMIWTVLGL